MNNQVSLSNLLSATVDTIRSNIQLAGVYLAIMIPVGTLMAVFQGGGRSFGMNFGFMLDESVMAQGALAIVVVLVGAIISIVATYWLVAGMTRGTVSPGFDRFWPYIGISILYGLGIVFGFILLIVPGIILMVRWVAVLPAVIDRDRDAIGSFGDSFGMTDGHSWSVFGAGLVVMVGMMVFSAVVGGVAVGVGTVAGGPGGIVMSAIAAIAEQANNVIGYAFCVGAYHLMRDRSEVMAEVFE